MDRIDRYLDQVCRGIAGGRSLREHLRQELREHLQDAAAQYQAAGMSEEESLAKALDDFGGPEQVHSELAATHGQQVMTLLIDRAIEWKENTMRAKWLWASWAYLALGAVIVIELWFVTFVMLKIVPIHQRVQADGWGDAAGETAKWWFASDAGPLGTAIGVARLLGSWGLLWIVLIAIGVGLFEWRVRSDNKALMRMAALASLALALLVLVMLTASGLAVEYAVVLFAVMARQPEGNVIEQERRIDRSLGGLEQALASKDWAAIERLTSDAARAAGEIDRWGASAPTIGALQQSKPLELNEVRARIKSAHHSLWEAQAASVAKDEDRLQASLAQFRDAYAPLKVPAAKD